MKLHLISLSCTLAIIEFVFLFLASMRILEGNDFINYYDFVSDHMNTPLLMDRFCSAVLQRFKNHLFIENAKFFLNLRNNEKSPKK